MHSAAWDRERDERGPVAAAHYNRNGFVHCCYREQIAEIGRWGFDLGDDLVALEVDASSLTHELRHERGPERTYPHVYGPLDRASVVNVHVLHRSKMGDVTVPPALAMPPAGYRLSGVHRGTKAEITWLGGGLDGWLPWIDDAHEAVRGARLVEEFGGVVAPASLDTAFASYCVLADVADEVTSYHGDGFRE
jgi:uncharacterized protein (DUF952 family)